MSDTIHKDQADELRKLVKLHKEPNDQSMEENEITNLPPRSTIHKNKKSKKGKKENKRIQFPLIRLFLVLFLLLVVLAVTSPYWLDYVQGL